MSDDIRNPEEVMKEAVEILDPVAEDLQKSLDENPALRRLNEKTKTLADKIQSGELNIKQGMSELNMLVDDPEVQKIVRELDPAGGLGSLLSVLPTGHNQIEDPSKRLFQPDPDRLPQAHPLYMARLMERLQFDGDAPELRYGALPKQSTPAVPVETEAMSPAAIGAQLKTASVEVQAQIDSNLREAAEKIGADLDPEDAERDAHGNLVKPEQGVMTLLEDPSLDPSGYQRGQVPALRKVEGLNGGQLATLPDKEQEELAFHAIGTTQGRRSSSPVVYKNLAERLRKDGLEIVEKDGEGQPLAEHEWVQSISGRAVQPRFSPVATAIGALHAGLKKQLKEGTGSVILRVGPVNRISDREVGWYARLYAA